MAIPSAAKHTPLDQPNANVLPVDRSGRWSMDELQRQTKLRNYVVGMGRIIPCSCTGTNVLTLTPNGSGGEDGEGPLIEGYRFGDIFLFVAAETSTGAVTATVVPKKGTLTTLKVYIDGGASQAGSGDITQGHVYMGVYHYGLDGGAGGIVIRHP